MTETEVRELIQFIEEETIGITIKPDYKRTMNDAMDCALKGDQYSCYRLSAVAVAIMIAKSVLKRVQVYDAGAMITNYSGYCSMDEVSGFVEIKLANGQGIDGVGITVYFLGLNPSKKVDNIVETCSTNPFSVTLIAPGASPRERILTGTPKEIVIKTASAIITMIQ